MDLCRKLHSLQLKDKESAQTHIKVMTEILDSLMVAGETVLEEDRVVYLLASLPESYNVLMTALEANEDVPKLEVVTKCILHQERKLKDKGQNAEGASAIIDNICPMDWKLISATVTNHVLHPRNGLWFWGLHKYRL